MLICCSRHFLLSMLKTVVLLNMFEDTLIKKKTFLVKIFFLFKSSKVFIIGNINICNIFL